ncbi:hypothetical protein [Streptomyces sp. Ag82_O1-15]|nr:hypothetical protein [Streptomyces sp. Ag82_O1-15]
MTQVTQVTQVTGGARWPGRWRGTGVPADGSAAGTPLFSGAESG